MRVTYTRDGTRIELDGDRLRALRTERGLTLAGVGDSIGRTAAAVCSLEHERWLPTLETCDALGRVFGKDLHKTGAIRVVKGWVAAEEKHMDEMHDKRMRDRK